MILVYRTPSSRKKMTSSLKTFSHSKLDLQRFLVFNSRGFAYQETSSSAPNRSNKTPRRVDILRTGAEDGEETKPFGAVDAAFRRRSFLEVLLGLAAKAVFLGVFFCFLSAVFFPSSSSSVFFPSSSSKDRFAR